MHACMRACMKFGEESGLSYALSMFRIALIAQKGGVGKTTLALSLAVQATLLKQRAAVIDADPQGTASAWYKGRKAQGLADPPVASVPAVSALGSALEAAEAEGFHWLFLDSPAGVSPLSVAVAELADLLLIPCQPSAFCMSAMESTVVLARRVQAPGYFVINRGSQSKSINDSCAVALASAYGLPATSTHITARIPITDAEAESTTLPELRTSSSSIKRGQEEFLALWQWLCQHQAKSSRLRTAEA